MQWGKLDVAEEFVQVSVDVFLGSPWPPHAPHMLPHALGKGIRVSEVCCLLGAVWIWNEGEQRKRQGLSKCQPSRGTGSVSLGLPWSRYCALV